MANITTIVAQLNTAEREIKKLRQQDPSSAVLPILESLHAALKDLTEIVRGDRV